MTNNEISRNENDRFDIMSYHGPQVGWEQDHLGMDRKTAWGVAKMIVESGRPVSVYKAGELLDPVWRGPITREAFDVKWSTRSGF